MTHREFMAWESFLDSEYDDNLPLVCHYLMRVAQRVEQANPRIKPSSATLEGQKIPFKTRHSKKPTKMTAAESAALSKSRWLGMMTAPVTRRTVPPE